MSDKLLQEIDKKITELEAQLEAKKKELDPIKKELEFYGDIRRRLTGLTPAPTREQIKNLTGKEANYIATLESEVSRLRAELGNETKEKLW